ncbi:MAG TPA: DUF2784 domain-containing protein [Gemmatimonadales bacterium]|nr:DUF2784 domain-containing protein [Gemmatimonadales bacterium]
MRFHSFLADVVVVIHVAFVLFVVLGGLLALRRPRLAWLHLPAAAWGAVISMAGWVCPLTPLENWLRRRAGAAGYDGSFIEHYLVPLLYPGALTRELQIGLGLAVVVVNAVIYHQVIRRWRPAPRAHRVS